MTLRISQCRTIRGRRVSLAPSAAYRRLPPGSWGLSAWSSVIASDASSPAIESSRFIEHVERRAHDQLRLVARQLRLRLAVHPDRKVVMRARSLSAQAVRAHYHVTSASVPAACSDRRGALGSFVTAMHLFDAAGRPDAGRAAVIGISLTCARIQKVESRGSCVPRAPELSRSEPSRSPRRPGTPCAALTVAPGSCCSDATVGQRWRA